LGRKDNIINSGGIKIQIEQVEDRLKEYITSPFLITSAPDTKFGEIIVLLYENEEEKTLRDICKSALPSYWIPKQYVKIKKLPLTETGKPDRATARRMIK
jgi:O-succinylbenzoic acid--CoA ligase